MNFATFVLVVFAAVAASQVSALAPRRACHCPRIYMPVCASNGKTFSNECEFNCVAKLDSSLKLAKHGGCETEEVQQPRVAIDEPKKAACACPMIYSPVCGTDGATYSNTCTLNCEVKRGSDVAVAYEGTCNHEDESNLVVD